jgi:thiol-disulfide isomerase/thioredoxin
MAFPVLAADARSQGVFSVLRVGAPPIPVTSFPGKLVTLVFISTTCPHCQEFTAKLIPIANEYAPRGVQFLECAVNPGAMFSVAGFIQQFQPPFPVGYSDQDKVDAYLNRSPVAIFYVPHVVFLDRAGKMAADYPGESDFIKDPAANTRKELDKLLTVKPPVKKSAAR